MRLVHWSAEIITTRVKGSRQIDHLDPEQRNRGLPGKPRGFWVSEETHGAYGWRSWCRAERFRPYGFRYEYEVKLAPNAKILYLRSAKDIDAFTHRYGYSFLDAINEARGVENPKRYNDPMIDGIDWRRVAQRYHGIIITPYIWERRLEFSSQWYYSWDCASGCIWNARAIESITMVRERKVPKKPTLHQMRRKRKRDLERMVETSKKLLMSELKR